MILDRDAEIPMRDGAILRANVYRPAASAGEVQPPGPLGGIVTCQFAASSASRVKQRVLNSSQSWS